MTKQISLHSSFGSSSIYQKRHRTTFNQYQLHMLEDAFKQNKYPGPSFRETLASKTNLDSSRVQVWFQNRRAKHKKQFSQAMKQIVASATCQHHHDQYTSLASHLASHHNHNHNQQQQHQNHCPSNGFSFGDVAAALAANSIGQQSPSGGSVYAAPTSVGLTGQNAPEALHRAALSAAAAVAISSASTRVSTPSAHIPTTTCATSTAIDYCFGSSTGPTGSPQPTTTIGGQQQQQHEEDIILDQQQLQQDQDYHAAAYQQRQQQQQQQQQQQHQYYDCYTHIGSLARSAVVYLHN